MRRNLAIVFSLVVVLAVTTYFGLYINNAPSDGGESFGLAEVGNKMEDAETYINERGERWGPLALETHGVIASAEDVMPKFVEYNISPLKVHPGDVQKMRVVLRDDVEIESVVAEVETDNGIKIVPLLRVSKDMVTKNDFLQQEYFVYNGVLKIADEENRHLAVPEWFTQSSFAARDGLFGKEARAQAPVLYKYTYEGQWLVRDTSERTYLTTFIAKDVSGRENSVAMAWSDPVPCPGVSLAACGSVAVSGNCTVNVTEIEGTDNGNISLNSGINVNLATESFLGAGNGGTLAWTPGYQINIGGGTITINTGAKITEGYIFLRDVDGDNYSPEGVTKKYRDSSASEAGLKRLCSILGTNDCYDANILAYPGAPTWRDVHRGDGSFDYDCDGSGMGSGGTAPAAGRCETYLTPLCATYDGVKEGSVGFTTAVSCNNSGTYVVDPGGCFPPELDEPSTQCITETRTNNCTVAEKFWPENGKCNTYNPFCSYNPSLEGYAGFIGSRSCGQSGSYVAVPGGCVNNVLQVCGPLETRKQWCK